TVMSVVGVSARIAFVLFFFQAEDGIRDKLVTGVQTCALPISSAIRTSGGVNGGCPHRSRRRSEGNPAPGSTAPGSLGGCFARTTTTSGRLPPRGHTRGGRSHNGQIGRASCRERVQGAGGSGRW